MSKRTYFLSSTVIIFATFLAFHPVKIQASTIMNSQDSKDNNQYRAQITDEEEGFHWDGIDDETKTDTINLAAQEAFERGEEYSSQDQIESAISEFSEAIRLDPDFAESYYQRSLLLISDNPQSAMEDAKKAHQLLLEQGGEERAEAMKTHLNRIQKKIEENFQDDSLLD